MKVDNLEDLYKLSPIQEGMLFHSLYAPQSDTYFRQWSCVIKGRLAVPLFKQSWQEVLDRHSILRTSFHWEEIEKPLQVVHRAIALPLELADWRELDRVDRQERMEAFLKSDQDRGFDFAQAPLMRLALIRISEDAHYFVWSYHHLLLDGWSKFLLFKEALALYEAHSQGRRSTLTLANVRPYRDYIAWLQEQDLSKAASYWQARLRGFRTPTRFGVDKAEENGPKDNYGECQVILSAKVHEQAQSLVRQNGLTINTLVQGIWSLLLSRYSGEDDVVFGVVVAGRPADLLGVEDMVGVFINTLPMRVEVRSSIPVANWLKQLQGQLVEMREYEFSPLVKVQQWSEVDRAQSLFESILVFENYPVDSALRGQPASVSVSNGRLIERNNYPLTLLAAAGTQLMLKIPYDRNRFDEASIVRMLAHLEAILENMVEEPWQPLSQVKMLAESEQHQLLHEWTDNRTLRLQRSSMLDLFRHQVDRTPQAVAVIYNDEHLTFADLNRRSTQLARYLRKIGVRPEVPVAVYLERSPELIIGILGVLKAGGIYLPLNPEYPKDRILFQLTDAKVGMIVTRQDLILSLPVEAVESELVSLDSDWQEIAREDQDNLPDITASENAAYAIYTSGSTGKPKGTLISYGAAFDHFISIIEEFELTAEDRVFQFASTSFDVSIEQIIPTLLSGASLVLRANEMYGASETVSQMATLQLSVINLPTAFGHQLASELAGSGNSRVVSPLRLVIIGGEQMLPETAVLWRRASPGSIRLLNAYGPTECTITSTTYDIPESVSSSSKGSISIGRALPNRTTYILDGDGNSTPVGVLGELLIGGPLLARSYLNRADITAENFTPDPLSGESGARLYKTGDIARYLPDGSIEFFARRDNQVKIRGYRVEPGEIEAILIRYPGIQQIVVQPRADNSGSNRLIAYFTAQPNSAVSITELRQYLQERVPEYMIPSGFVLLESLPLTVNGKVNRSALPTPEKFSTLEDDEFVAPRTPVELQLAQIWSELLGVDRIGIGNNFFDLGGHSLLMTQLASRLRSAFQIDLSLRELFENPTIAEMTVLIALAQAQDENLADVVQIVDELRREASQSF